MTADIQKAEDQRPTTKTGDEDRNDATVSSCYMYLPYASPGALLSAIGEHQAVWASMLNLCIAVCHRVLLK